MDSLVAIYKQLHANPELSTQEEQTLALIAKELRAAGFEVTDYFGQYALPETKAYGVAAAKERAGADGDGTHGHGCAADGGEYWNAVREQRACKSGRTGQKWE